MGNDLVQISDYKDYTSLLIQLFKDKTKFVSMLEKVADQCNNIETAIFEFQNEFDIDTAVGDQLDIIGIIQGEERLGKSDADYRKVIKAKIILNAGSGEPETLITALTDIYGATNVHFQNIGYAVALIWVDIVIDSATYNILLELVPSGVNLVITMGSTNPFVFFDDTDGNGFTKLSDDDYYLFDTAGDRVTDTVGDFILTFVNEPDLDHGGEIQGCWQVS